MRKRYSDGKREQRTLAKIFCACFVNRLVSSWGLRQRRSEQGIFRAAANLAVATGVGCGQRENVSKHQYGAQRADKCGAQSGTCHASARANHFPARPSDPVPMAHPALSPQAEIEW